MSVDRVAQILERLPEQFKGKPGWEAFLTAIGGEIQALEDAHQQLLTLRGINSATGAQLEALGNLVGEPPTGLDDDTYRRYIRARVAANRSRGTTPDLIKIARLVLTDGTTTPTVTIKNRGTAAVFVHIAGAAIDDDLADALIRFLHAAVRGGGPAGVRVYLETSEYPPEERFSFENGPGLGYGVAARLELALVTGSAIDTVLRATVPGEAAHAYTLEFAASGVGTGLLSNVGSAYLFEFEDAVTTIEDFENSVNALDNEPIHVVTPSATPSSTITNASAFSATAFSGGTDGGRYSGMRI